MKFVILGLLALKKSTALSPVTTRRLVLTTPALLPLVAKADVLELDPAVVSIPSVWRRDGDKLIDPVLGTITSDFKVHKTPSTVESIASFQIDTFDLGKLGLKAPREKGDIVAARQRIEKNRVYYDWDLAVAPETCPKSQQLVVTTCLPNEVALVSATIANGEFVVFEVGVTPTEWKNSATALRSLRSSFIVL